MATAELARVDQRVVLRGVSWDTYRQLAADCADSHAAHFFYDRGMLEIMVLSFEHESLNRLLATLFEVVAEEREIDFENAGSTTYQDEDLSRGFEADTAFYVEHAAAVRGKKQIDLRIDPPPDVVMEVDVSRSSVTKLPTFAAVGVGEVWQAEEGRVRIWLLTDGKYVASEESRALPGLQAKEIESWLAKREEMTRVEWLKALRAWVQQRFGAS
ncbi:MAG: Uma2 family endonuclease [Gemmataceae bacterium]